MLVKHFDWDDAKNAKLQAERGIGFEEIVFHIERGDLLDVLEHPHPERYAGQRIFVVRRDDYVYLVGRLKESYRCGGEMVMPREVELLLAEHAGVGQAHVVGVPHPRMGEVGCAVIVAAAENVPNAAELVAHCTANLARFKVPAQVVFFEASDLPMTVTGRVQKFRLAELVKTRLKA